jgi:HEPN domain-containing protein
VRRWLLKAFSDLESAKRLASGEDPRLDTAIYHCQQCGEKAIKGFLVAQGVEPDRTHDVAQLIEEAIEFDESFAPLISLGVELTPYATLFRYPSVTLRSEPTQEEFDVALDAAERIYNFVLSRLPEEVRP